MAQYIGFSTINANKPKTTNNVSGAWAAGGDGGPGGIRQGIDGNAVDRCLSFINKLE